MPHLDSIVSKVVEICRIGKEQVRAGNAKPKQQILDSLLNVLELMYECHGDKLMSDIDRNLNVKGIGKICLQNVKGEMLKKCADSAWGGIAQLIKKNRPAPGDIVPHITSNWESNLKREVNTAKKRDKAKFEELSNGKIKTEKFEKVLDEIPKKAVRDLRELFIDEDPFRN